MDKKHSHSQTHYEVYFYHQLMISLGDNTFTHPNSFINKDIDYNLFHKIKFDDSPLTDRLTWHQFIATVCSEYKRLCQEDAQYIYSPFNDERYIIIALAGMLSGKTVLSCDINDGRNIFYIDDLSISTDIDYTETLNEIDKRIINKEVGYMVFYTSGSTGKPQTVHLSWYNIMIAVYSFINDPYVDYSGYETALHFLPHSHIYGFLMELMFIALGMRIYYTTAQNVYQSYLSIKPSIIPMVPAVLNKLYEKQLPLHLKLLICAGAPLRADVAEFYKKTCRQILKGYGTTETSACILLSVNPDDDGICTAANLIRIDDDGELLVKGLSIGCVQTDNDGWYHTNDIVSIDSNRRLHIIGRKNNIIKLSQGEFVNLDELSNLYTYKSVDTIVYASSLYRYPKAIVYVDDTIDRSSIPKLFNDIHESNNRKGFERITDIIIRDIKEMPLINGIKPNYKLIRENAIKSSTLLNKN